MINAKKNQKRIIVFSVILILVALCVAALDLSLNIVFYKISTNKLENPVRVAFLSDLHSCYYGEGQFELLDAIDSVSPDLVLLGGDILDDELPHENSFSVLKHISKKYSCYYVSGNHEYWSGEMDILKKAIRELGIVVLEGDCSLVDFGDQRLTVSGIDDPDKIGEKAMFSQLERTAKKISDSDFNILIAHRPEYIEKYIEHNFDLILSGHAHGGQWRIPIIANGLFAPGQGFLPKYAGGEYKFGDQTFIVSRGLATDSIAIPRLFNRPEIVVVDIVPAF